MSETSSGGFALRKNVADSRPPCSSERKPWGHQVGSGDILRSPSSRQQPRRSGHPPEPDEHIHRGGFEMTTIKACLGGAILAILMQSTVVEFVKDRYQSWAGCDTITECKPVETD